MSDGNSGFYLVGGTLNGAPQHTRYFPRSTCVSGCAGETISGADIPVALTNVSAYQLAVATPCATTLSLANVKATGRILVVGEGAAGTQSFIITLPVMSSSMTVPATVTAVPLREPRRGATAIPVPIGAPLGAFAILGGEHLDGGPAQSVELFTP